MLDGCVFLGLKIDLGGVDHFGFGTGVNKLGEIEETGDPSEGSEITG